jgi:hypothetical protein
VDFWQRFLNCCRHRQKDTYSTAELAYHTQTALIMGMLALRESKVARFDSAQDKIML